MDRTRRGLFPTSPLAMGRGSWRSRSRTMAGRPGRTISSMAVRPLTMEPLESGIVGLPSINAAPGGTDGACDIGAVEWVPSIIMVTDAGTAEADDGQCTLPEAIVAANTNTASGTTDGECAAGDNGYVDRIVFDEAVGDMTLTAALPVVSSLIVIEGGGVRIERDRGDTNDPLYEADKPCTWTTSPFRIVTVTAAGDLTLDHVTLSYGCADGARGGGIYSEGPLTLMNSTVSDNATTVHGGGIAVHSAELTVQASTVSGNKADIYGGGIWAYGSSTATVIQSTISGNQADSYGGGIATRGNGLSGSMDIRFSTITGNSATRIGGGVFVFDVDLNIQVSGSLLAGNTAPHASEVSGGILFGPEPNLYGHTGLTDAQAFNRGFAPREEDIFATSEGLNVALSRILDSTLTDNGGLTATHDLVAGSPALDAAGMCGLNEDQRGLPRDLDACDIGAVEWQGAGQ